jgi:hypothetical protein
LRNVEAMRQEAKADAAALPSGVGQFREAAHLAQEAQKHSPGAAQKRLAARPRTASSSPPLLGEFRVKRAALRRRESSDGLGARDFCGRCDARANTLALILHTGGNVGIVEWSNKVVRILGAFFASTIPHLSIKAFVRLGLLSSAAGKLLLRADRELAREVRSSRARRRRSARKRIKLPTRYTQSPQ